MTLLASFRAFEIPILVGDMLITRNGITPPQRIGAKKKIHILSSNCAIGWTGFLDSAEIVFQKLFQEINADRCDFQLLDEILTSFSQDEFRGSPVKVVGWIVDDAARCFRWDSRFPHHVSCPESSFDGSAYEVMKNMVGGHMISDPSRPKERNIQRAIASSLNLLIRLVADEMLGLSDPVLAFGHQFEEVYYDFDTGFKYLDNLLYLVLDVEIESNYQVVRHALTGPVHKYRTFGNYSLMEFYYPERNHTDFDMITPIGFVDPKIEEGIMSLARPGTYKLQLLSSYYCVLIRYISNGTLFDTLGCILKDGGKPESGFFITVDDSNVLDLHISDEWLKYVLDEIIKN